MPGTPQEWNEKHRRAAAEEHQQEPTPLVRELLPLLPSGPALDLACGRGRHTIFLAERGYPVTAVDWSEVAIGALEKRALAAGLTVKREAKERATLPASTSGIRTICRDLRGVALPESAFSLILCIHYLDRRLWPAICDALAPGGAVLFETYTTAQLAFQGGPRNPEYLLQPGELRHAFPGLQTIFYRELRAGQGIASLLAWKAAKSGQESQGFAIAERRPYPKASE
jgi:tellurite methyltransferase